MMTRDDWDAAYQQQLAEGRSRVAPPTYEEFEALTAGRLSEADADRVRETLSYYPELVRLFTEPLSANGEGVLSEEELSADLASVRERVRHLPPLQSEPAEGRQSRVFALAAGVVIALALGGVAVWRMTSRPRPLLSQVLYPEGTRGGVPGVPSVTPVRLSKGNDYMLEPAFDSPRSYREYRVELLDLSATPPRRVWLRENVTPRADGTFPVRLETDDLDAGLYRLVLYGVDGTADDLAEYTIRLRDE